MANGTNTQELIEYVLMEALRLKWNSIKREIKTFYYYYYFHNIAVLGKFTDFLLWS